MLSCSHRVHTNRNTADAADSRAQPQRGLRPCTLTDVHSITEQCAAPAGATVHGKTQSHGRLGDSAGVSRPPQVPPEPESRASSRRLPSSSLFDATTTF